MLGSHGWIKSAILAREYPYHRHSTHDRSTGAWARGHVPVAQRHHTIQKKHNSQKCFLRNPSTPRRQTDSYDPPRAVPVEFSSYAGPTNPNALRQLVAQFQTGHTLTPQVTFIPPASATSYIQSHKSTTNNTAPRTCRRAVLPPPTST